MDDLEVPMNRSIVSVDLEATVDNPKTSKYEVVFPTIVVDLDAETEQVK